MDKDASLKNGVARKRAVNTVAQLEPQKSSLEYSRPPTDLLDMEKEKLSYENTPPPPDTADGDIGVTG